MTPAPGRRPSFTPHENILASAENTQFDETLERLRLLIPELAATPTRDLQTYALAYTERYRGDPLQLEPDWPFLATALLHAWRRNESANIISLARELTLLATRRKRFAEAECILRMGIAASRHAADRQRLASFVNHLGLLFFAHGNYRHGWRLWRLGLRIAHSCEHYPSLWQPIASFAQITDLLGNFTTAQHFLDTVMNHPSSDDAVAVALFARGFYARVSNQPDASYADLSACLRLLSIHHPLATRASTHQLFMQSVQAELARVQGDYTRAHTSTEAAYALAILLGDHYTAATLLIDQSLFTFQHGHRDDLRALSLRLRDLLPHISAPHIAHASRFWERHLAADPPPSHALPALPALPAPHPSTPLLTPPTTTLGAREHEVLHLVALGHPNRAIAAELVITTATVKKHLEHIYSKLDAHNRTSAIARARRLALLP